MGTTLTCDRIFHLRKQRTPQNKGKSLKIGLQKFGNFPHFYWGPIIFFIANDN